MTERQKEARRALVRRLSIAMRRAISADVMVPLSVAKRLQKAGLATIIPGFEHRATAWSKRVGPVSVLIDVTDEGRAAVEAYRKGLLP